MVSKLGSGLITLAIIGMAGSFLWWMRFYSDINFVLSGRSGPLPVECLYERSGPCRIISDVATWIGYRAYDPMLFWFSVAGFAAGLFLLIISGLIEPYHRAPPARRQEPYI